MPTDPDLPRPDRTPPPAHKRPAEGSDATRKPTLPPGAKKATLPPTGTRKPTLPPGSGKKPTLPPGAKKPTLPPGGDGASGDAPGLTRKDFATDQDVRWCPGCGDYAILATVQRLLPELGVTRENTVFLSGIGCSSRFPYYMNTYGFHSIHGRAPAIATGLKTTRPDLDVWVITGDGDALSIGGNHLIHLLRRNVDVQLLLFNNQIYGLTKGQYSPTSEAGKVTKSTPYGSLDHPFNPLAVALGADASFVARSLDRDPKHLAQTLRRAHEHRGTSFVEIYQNCNIFNDGAFFEFTERDTKPLRTIQLEHGQPMTFDGGQRGLRLEGLRLTSIDLSTGDLTADDCLVHDETDRALAHLLSQLFWTQPDGDAALPRPFGVIHREDRPTYDALLQQQLADVAERKGRGDLSALLAGNATWTID
jgi:2-oxoglutarate ferredoxin oxidoreductase subunit beta